jgi:hypothetical protein
LSINYQVKILFSLLYGAFRRVSDGPRLNDAARMDGRLRYPDHWTCPELFGYGGDDRYGVFIGLYPLFPLAQEPDRAGRAVFAVDFRVFALKAFFTQIDLVLHAQV